MPEGNASESRRCVKRCCSQSSLATHTMEVYQVLMCLRDNAITASQFFLTLLTDPEYSLLPASLDLRSHSSHSNEILFALDQTPKPLEVDVEMFNAIETVQRRICSEIEDLTLVEYLALCGYSCNGSTARRLPSQGDG
jgi:hypothetical protein